MWVRSWALLSLLAWSSAPAWAVDARDVTWKAISPRPGTAFVDAAGKPDDPLQVVALAADGSLYLSRDGGRGWTQVLGPDGRDLGYSDDEQTILDVEVRFQEVLEEAVVGDGLDPDATDIDPQAVEDTVVEALDAASTEVFGDLEADPDFVVSGAGPGSVLEGRVVWTPTGLFVGLPGRLLYSKTDGRSWETVLDVTTWDVVPLADRIVALTDDGARLAFDARAWFDLDDGTEAEALVAGARAERLLAASNEGLWASDVGEGWAPWGSLRAPVASLAVEPDRPSRVWVTTPAGLQVSEDGGLTFGAPVYRGVADDVICLGGDLVVAILDGAVVQTDDGGASFTPLRRGLDRVTSGRLARRADGALVVAGAEGLFALRPLVAADDAGGPWVPLDTLIDRSVAREGVTREFDAFRRRWSAALMPQFILEAYVQEGLDKGWSAALGTEEDTAQDWRVLGRLLWVPRGSRSRSLRGDLSGFDIDPGVLTVRGEPLLVAGEDDYVVAARLDRASMEYASELVSVLNDLYHTRLELLAERRRAQVDTLLRRVLHEIAIDEVEAKMDALTDGAVARWRAEAPPREM